MVFGDWSYKKYFGVPVFVLVLAGIALIIAKKKKLLVGKKGLKI
jgi:hypothetical protein